MKISDSVSSLKIPFRIPAAGGRFLDRSVNAFMVADKGICLVDACVAGSAGPVFAMVRDTGRDPGEVSFLILTHSHPDHIGGASAIQGATECIVAAHPAERAWIEDTDLQARERPIPGFSTLVEGAVRIDRLLSDGDRIGIGGGRSLAVVHTPGHSPGSISLFLEDEGVLISGDAIPVKGEIPVYDDPFASIRSIEKLERLSGVKVLLSSWDSPKRGGEIPKAMADGKEIIHTIHAAVVKAAKSDPDPASVTRRVVETLGLPEAALPVISRTVMGHLRAIDRKKEFS
ncbi:MAG: MBL fold metallo-hydrolase [Methanomicrobiales archaeon]|jgi:glyoxylase-like metal-dependent hydrolase (beta-lactamase superfamily II)